ncbi:MAG TPA: phosphotransferase [Trueperaceae bacterium]
MLSQAEQRFLRQAYGWSAATSFHELQQGENDHALVQPPDGRYVVRRYRAGGRSRIEIEAELAWMQALRDSLSIPDVLPDREGRLHTHHIAEDGAEVSYAVFEFVDGTTLEPTPDSYEAMGGMLRALHEATSRVARQRDADWPGWQRPVLDQHTVLEESLRSILAAPFLPTGDKTAFERLAVKLADLWQHRLTDRQFIHADLHLGNVLECNHGYTCLDFDESGFGPRAFDIASVRLHPITHGYLTEVWPAFVRGYGPVPSDADLRLATALRFFYMAGKVPLRLDMPALNHQPEHRLRRYFGHILAQLEEV